jgi:hypothetical protein
MSFSTLSRGQPQPSIGADANLRPVYSPVKHQARGYALAEKVFSRELQTLMMYGKTKGGRPYYYGVKFRDMPLPIAAHTPATPARQEPRLAVDNTAHAMAI